ncbi:probable beta-taxilin [Coccomyxa sp. Obi]|nr:probable beta-taxilin [Coccomyxa sp. Obi]
MVTVQEAPIVSPPETTGTSANDDPKSLPAEPLGISNGAAPVDCNDDSQKENIDSKSLILSRLKELEEETGEPERRENQRRRKKQVKDIQAFLQDRSKTLEEKLEFLQQKILSQFKEQSRLEAELIPVRIKAEKATKAKEEAQAELVAKNNLNAKLQELSRKLQQQNKEMKEEDVLQRKQMIENFQNTLSDLKSRVDENNVRREEAFNEKKGLLDMQIVMEEHHKAKIREMEVRLELADAKLRQAELTSAEHLHTAQIEAANFKEASRLLNDMGDKYKHFETTMKESTEAFKKMSADSTEQLKLNVKMEALLAAREKEVQRVKGDLTAANAKIIQLASEAHALKTQLAEEGSAVIELERVRAQNTMLQKLARTLQQEVKALKSMTALGGDSAAADKVLPAAEQDQLTADPQSSSAVVE